MTRDGVPIAGVAEGWRRRALLTLIAVAPSGGISRELLARQLWPDSDADSGRHSLDQLLYTIRRSVGRNPFGAGDGLQFDDRVIATDVAEFQDAVRHRQFDRAISLYAGDFADGLELDTSEEAQRRIAAARQQFAKDRAVALESLARSATQRNDAVGAIRWWQQLVDSDPLNGRASGEYIAALVAGGEHARALKFALLHQALIAEEVGTQPGPEIVRWIERLRAGSGVAGTVDGATRRAPDSSIGVSDSDDLRAKRFARLLGSRYELGPIVSEGSVSADYSSRSRSDGRAERLVRLIQPRLAMIASAPRFREVLERVVRLSHVTVHATLDFGASDDLLFVVTAPRAPRSLRDRLQAEGALPIEDALAIARDVAVALSLAHANGVRHGDLRPKHVDLTARGSGAAVAGLGIAEAITPAASGYATSTVVTIGSPAYLSPEQLLRQGPADARSDVYAFGCILYEMLTGEPPFGRTPQADALSLKLAGQHTAVRERRPSASSQLAETVDTCLARMPADRFASATELAEALGRVQ